MPVRPLTMTLLGLFLPLLAPVPHEVAAPPAPPAPITINATSASWRQRIEWALDRFETAGLPMPPVTITVHDDDAPCDGNSGLFRPRTASVHLCSPGAPESRAARLIALHELAHAWAESALTTDDRRAFLDQRDLDAWVEPRLPRHEWGAEHIAEVVSWGLMDEQIPIIRINDAEPAALLQAFELVTDRPPLWAPDPEVVLWSAFWRHVSPER